ncbi:MAG: segregation and condensation protein A [Candidatus Weimeria sp.]
MEEALDVKLPAFSGPLELLLHLIEKNKVSIYDIPIAVITDQYMAYLDRMEETDLDTMSAFLLMASTLLSIKAKMLLPEKKKQDEEEEEADPRQELVEALLEYKMYHELAAELKKREDAAGLVIYKDPTIPPEVRDYEAPVNPDELLDGITLKKLNEVFNEVLRRQKERVDPIRSKFGSIRKEKISLEKKTGELLDFARSHSHFSFKNLFEETTSKTEVIVTFLAVLELMKTGQIKARQEEIFGDIEMESQVA